MNQGLATLAEYLTATLKDDNNLRRAAEEELTKLSQNSEEYLDGLLQLVSVSHPDVSSQLKNAAAINLKKQIKDLCDSPSITKDQRLFYAKKIFLVLVTNGLDSSVRGSLGYSLVPLFAGQPDVLVPFQPILAEAMSTGTYNMIGSIKTIKSIYSGFVHNPVLYPFFKKILPNFITIAYKTLSLLNQAIAESNNLLAIESCEIIYEWTTTVNSILEYFDISSKQSLSEIKEIAELPLVLKDIIGIVIPDKELAGVSIINVSPNSITIKLNQAKTQSLQCFNLIVQYLIDHKKKLAEEERSDKVITSVGLDMPDSPYLNCISDMMPSIISSLEFVSYHPNTDQLMESEYISELFIELLLILNKISSDNRFIQIFTEGFKHIIVNICLPLLKASLSDIETFEESPEEFVALSCDICERQESETVKSTAAQLLESLCNRIDGSLRFIINFTFEVIDWTVTHKPLTDYQNLPQFAQSKILQASEELRIEALLLSACIVSYTAGKRKDLVTTIEVLFTTHLNTLYTNGTGIIKNRLCMLIHYYSEYIFINENDSFRSLVLIVLKSCNPQQNPISSVNIQASETLSFMLQEEEILMRIYDFIPEMVSHIISIVQYQNSKAFFEALQEIITSNTNLIIPHLAVLVPSLVTKVISETEIRKEKKNKSSILIVKCWNIIRALVECKTLTIEQVLELEDQFIPLLEYIKSPKDIDFDDDIILFEVSVMRRCQTVTQIGWNIFIHLPLVQEKYDNTFVQLFQVLNCYIFYGSRVLLENPSYLATISEMCGKCLFATYKNKINEATNAEAALIYQQLIFTFKGELNDILPSILAFAILKLSTVIKNDFFRARVLGIILASFSYDCNFTLEILNNSQLISGQTYFDYVFGEISQNSHIFKHPYDKKVAISGLCSFFNNPNLARTYTLVFQLIIEILANTNKDILPIKNLDLNEDSAISYMKESLKDYNSEEMEASLGLTTYLTPLDSFDEYNYFRALTKSFQQNDLSILIKALNKPQVEKLTEVLQTKKVAINNNTAHTEPRRIVKPKSRINN